MNKKMQKTIVVFCLLALMLVPCQAIFASESVGSEYPVQPLMVIIDDYTITFGIVNGVANVDVSVDGDPLDATRAKVIAELQVKNGSSWIPVAIWTEDSDDYYARVYETHDVVKGHTYRVKGTFMVWEGDAYETEYDYSPEITA